MDQSLKIKFLILWQQAMDNNYSSSDAREYASLELFGKSFAESFN